MSEFVKTAIREKLAGRVLHPSSRSSISESEFFREFERLIERYLRVPTQDEIDAAAEEYGSYLRKLATHGEIREGAVGPAVKEFARQVGQSVVAKARDKPRRRPQRPPR